MQHPHPNPPQRSRYLIPALCIAFALAMALTSAGFLEPDEIMHFLYARAVWHDWRYLVNIWGRLGVTGLYSLTAHPYGGVVASRILAVAITALTALGTTRLLRALAPEPPPPESWFARHATAWVWLLLFAQPCFALNSFTVMTEMPLACTWVWAAVLVLRHTRASILLASLLIGLGGLMRPEGWLAIAAWPFFLTILARPGLLPSNPLQRSSFSIQRSPISSFVFRLLSFTLSLLPVAAWYLLGVFARHDWSWVAASWPWSPESQYGRNAGLFLVSALAALAGWMWIPVLAGTWDAWTNRSAPRLLILALPTAAFFLLHGLLGSLGLFASMSLPRYFICVAPFLAVLAVQGLITMELRKPKNRISLRISIVALTILPLAALAATGYLPMRPTSEQERLEAAARYLVQHHVRADQIIVGHPYMLWRLGLDPDAPAHTRVHSRQAMAAAPRDALVITDATVWSYENYASNDELSHWGYHVDKTAAAAIDKIPDRFEPLLFRPDPEARVQIWTRAIPPPVPPARLTTRPAATRPPATRPTTTRAPATRIE